MNKDFMLSVDFLTGLKIPFHQFTGRFPGGSRRLVAFRSINKVVMLMLMISADDGGL